MAPMRVLLSLLLVLMLSLAAVGCTAQGEISDEGINAEVEGEDGGDGGDGG
jgi:hypothetical protein